MIRAVVAVVACLTLVACTPDTNTAPDVTVPTSTPAATATDAPPSVSPTPSQPAPSEGPVLFGTGSVTVDGTTMPVRGDCDISRDFGDQPVNRLGTEVAVLLAVDNLTTGGEHAGPFALQVRLLGANVVDGTVISVGAAGDGGSDVTYEGPIEVAELRDRQSLEFLDVATLHLEVTQERTRGSGGADTRELAVDVTCPIARPGD